MQTVIVTGGSSGIGKATAILFTTKGYRVFEFSRHGKSCNGVEHIDCDITKPDDCQRAVSHVYEQTKRIDILVSNAGMGISGAMEFTSQEEIRRQFDVNYFGAVNVVQAVVPLMRNANNGKIIFVSSLASFFPIPFQAYYSSSKAAINAMAISMRNELATFGIKVSCLLPGDVNTGFTDSRSKHHKGEEIYTHMNDAIQSMEKDEKNGAPPELLAKKIVSIARKNSPKMYYYLGAKYHIFILLGKILPRTLSTYIIGKMY